VRAGDVIVSFDGKPVERIKDLTRLVAATEEGKAPIEVWRDGDSKELTANIMHRDTESAQLAFAPHEQSPERDAEKAGKLGLALAPLSPQARARFQVSDDVNGAVIVGVKPDSPAGEEGLRPGDVIEMVGQQQVKEPQQVLDAVARATDQGRDAVLLLVRRGDDKRFVTVKLG
jgi:serine protease Do